MRASSFPLDFKKSLHFMMVAGRDQAYSTLEVVRQEPRYQADRQWKPPPSDPGKQVDPDCEKQYVGNNGGLELAAQKDQIDVRRIPARRFFTRKRIILCGAIGLILILAAVLGGIFGSRHKSSATASLSSPSNSSATSPSATPIQRNIAAVSFTSNSANNTRVYFQDAVGQIIEASNSAGNPTWSVKKTGIGAKNGSAIAAAVSRPNLPLVSPVSLLSIESCRYIFRKSPFSISMRKTLFTTQYIMSQQAFGLRELYRLKLTQQCQTPAYQPCTTGAGSAPILPSSLSKTRMALSRLAILHPVAGL